jgi:long-chain acyl-CoA synthetase
MQWASIEEVDKAVAGQTIPRQFLRTVAANKDLVALRSMDADGGWHDWAFGDYADYVARAAAGMRSLGLVAGDKVVLMMRNRPEFHALDMAAQFLRVVPISIYNSSSVEEIAYLTGHCEAKAAIVEDAGFLEKFLKVKGELPLVRHLVVMEPVEDVATEVHTLESLIAQEPLDLAQLAEESSPEDLATMIYTSGTTGPPKAVMLDQYNVVFTVESIRRTIVFTDYAGKKLISYLPMAHIAERLTSHYQQAVLGFTVTCCPDFSQIATYAREVHPNVLFGVPRVWEKIYAGVNAVLAGDPERKAKFDDAIAAAVPIVAKKAWGEATKEELETWDFLDAVAFSTVRGLVGLDELDLAVTGAAPMAPEIFEWFRAIGVPLAEVYGMSESSGPMTFTTDRVRAGTVGEAIPGCEVKIAEDGEVICRGGNVFRGYYKQPDKTAETLIDGWLHSGDIGTVDEDGFYKIVDRKKELIITAGGKNISPANLENGLKMIELIGQACAIGDARPFISALLVLDAEIAPVWAKAQGIEFDTLEDLAANPKVVEAVQKGVDEINQQFARVEQIRKFTLLGEEWLPDSDLLTPTQKLKRRGIHAHYADVIEAMYS